MDLNQITIPSSNLTKAVPFYEKLGLKLIVKALPHYARFACPNGNSTFSIHQIEKLPKKEEGILVYFECDELDKKVEDLKKQGVEFDQEPMDQPWLWREARLRDLDGNQLVLFYAGENRLDPPWRINKTKEA